MLPITAKYQDGVFKPLEEASLEDGTILQGSRIRVEHAFKACINAAFLDARALAPEVRERIPQRLKPLVCEVILHR
jgi:predicted DNA-binding antitoxin AbrB/MazE fold protein